MQKLKPAHEVAIEKIQHYCTILKDIGKAVDRAEAREARRAKCAAAWTPAIDLNRGRLQLLGSFHGHLESLQEMLIPEDNLKWVIEQLKKLDSRDPEIDLTVAELRQRIRTTAR